MAAGALRRARDYGRDGTFNVYQRQSVKVRKCVSKMSGLNSKRARKY